MLSQKAKYALRAVLLLAERQEDEELVLIAEIAEREQIPRKFLEAILVELRKDGILESRRGKNGGYRLARPLDRISFGDVIRSIDGPLAPIRCASRTQFQPCTDCQDVDTCSIRWAMTKARDAMANVLDGWTLADAVRQRHGIGAIPLNFAV
nr:Rrf2 family transcriptional regulator [Arenibaculum pallidiluteum]